MPQVVKLGDRVKDRISGFSGICTGLAAYLYGCVQVLVAPESCGPDGKCADSVWLDEGRVVVEVAGAIDAPVSAPDRQGGPVVNAPTGRR